MTSPGPVSTAIAAELIVVIAIIMAAAIIVNFGSITSAILDWVN